MDRSGLQTLGLIEFIASISPRLKAFFHQHISRAGTTMMFLCAVKSQDLIKLTQPVIDATLEHRRLLAPLSLAMGDQRTAHTALLTIADKTPQRSTRLFDAVPV